MWSKVFVQGLVAHGSVCVPEKVAQKAGPVRMLEHTGIMRVCSLAGAKSTQRLTFDGTFSESRRLSMFRKGSRPNRY